MPSRNTRGPLPWDDTAATTLPPPRRRLSASVPGKSVDMPPWTKRRARRMDPIFLWRQAPEDVGAGPQPSHVTRALGHGWPFQATLARLLPRMPAAVEGGQASTALLESLSLASWQASAAYAATAAQTGGHYAPVLRLRFPTLGRVLSTAVEVGTEPRIGRLDEGGIGAITIDLDETTSTLRLGHASFTLPNADQFMDTFQTALPFAQLPLVLSVGWAGTSDVMDIFTGVVDRWSITQHRISISAVPTDLQERRPISLTVRELIAIVRQETGESPFPFVPDDSLDAVIPLYLGVAKSVPLIPVGNSTYLSGFGVFSINAVRDNDEDIGGENSSDPASNLVLGQESRRCPYLLVRGHELHILKMLYEVEAGHTISIDINGLSSGTSALGAFGFLWNSAYSVSPYDRRPRPRKNLFTNGGFEFSTTEGFNVTGDATGVGEVVTLKPHEGFHALRVRSVNLTEEGEHRYVTTVSPLPPALIPGLTAYVSFWYIAGTSIAPGDPPSNEIASQLSVQINGGDWTILPSSQGFETMTEYATTIVSPGGTLDLKLRCEGLSAERSADIYLDDFVVWQEGPVHPFQDYGIEVYEGIRKVVDWMTTTRPLLDLWSVWSLQRGNWRFVSIIPNAVDAYALLTRMAQQLNAVVSKNRTGPNIGLYRLDALDANQESVAAFDPTNIIPDSFERFSAPADTIYSSFFADYTQDHGMIYLTPEGTNIPNGQALVTACKTRLALLGGDKQLRIPSDLILDKFTATALVQAAFTRYGFTGDLLQWRTWLDALPLTVIQQITVTHPVLPFGAGVQAELVGSHFLPDVMQVELVARALPTPLEPPGLQSAPIAKPIALSTPAGVAVGVSALLYVIPAPSTTIDVTSVVVGGLSPGSSGMFAVSSYGTIVFTPAAGFSGIVSAFYTIKDVLEVESNAATISISVGISSQLVVANADTATTTANTPVTFPLLANDSVVAPGVLAPELLDLDPNVVGRQVTFTDPGHGTFEVDDFGLVTFTPFLDYLGDAIAFYVVPSNEGDMSNITTITVTVTVAEVLAWVFAYTVYHPIDTPGDIGLLHVNCSALFLDVLLGGTGDLTTDVLLVGAACRLFNIPDGTVSTLFGTLGSPVMDPNKSALALSALAVHASTLFVAFQLGPADNSGGYTGPTILTLSTLVNLSSDDLLFDWALSLEVAGTYKRVGAFASFGGILYASFEPMVPGIDALDVWEYDGTWTLQHSFGTTPTTLRSFAVFGSALYAGVETGRLERFLTGAWATVHTFTGEITALVVWNGLLTIAVRNGSQSEIWTTADGTAYAQDADITGVGPINTFGQDVGGTLYAGLGGPASEAIVYSTSGSGWTLHKNFSATEDATMITVSVLAQSATGRLFATIGRTIAEGPDVDVWYLD